MNNKVDTVLISVKSTNQEPQEEKKPKAFLLHHSNQIFIDLLEKHLNKEGIEVQKEININRDNLNYQSAMEELQKYLGNYSPKTGDIFGVEANLGNPASKVPSCFPAIDEVLLKNPKAIIFVFTNTPDCITATLKKYQEKQVYYIGAQTFDSLQDKEIVGGRTFLNANKFYEFHKSLQVPASPTASSTFNNYGPVSSIASSSPKSKFENSTPVVPNKIKQFFKIISSCCSFKSTRNHDRSTTSMENSFMNVGEEQPREEQSSNINLKVNNHK